MECRRQCIEEGDAKHGLGFSGTHHEKAHSNGEFIEPIIYDNGLVKISSMHQTYERTKLELIGPIRRNG